uniref:Putative secreted protein n=1 Tax=Amblyomma parvum TaxID=251391 RepID=A0A023G238_AMBPA
MNNLKVSSISVLMLVSLLFLKMMLSVAIAKNPDTLYSFCMASKVIHAVFSIAGKHCASLFTAPRKHSLQISPDNLTILLCLT